MFYATNNPYQFGNSKTDQSCVNTWEKLIWKIQTSNTKKEPSKSDLWRPGRSGDRVVPAVCNSSNVFICLISNKPLHLIKIVWLLLVNLSVEDEFWHQLPVWGAVRFTVNHGPWWLLSRTTAYETTVTHDKNVIICPAAPNGSFSLWLIKAEWRSCL